MTNLDKLKELLGRMTPGPWYREPNTNSMLVAATARATGNRIYADCGSAYPGKDAQGIAALRNLAEAMVGVCETAKALAGEYADVDLWCDNDGADCEPECQVCKCCRALKTLDEALKREVGE